MTDAATVELIPLDSITLPAQDLRKRVDPAALAELAASIKAQGLIHPLTVRRLAPRKFRIVAGGRRYRALKLNGEDAAPCIIRELTDAQEAELRLVENLEREDLTVLELAAGYQLYLEQTKATQEQLAERIGKTPGHVSQVLAVLKLPKVGRELVADGKLTIAHARELNRLAGYPEKLEEELAILADDIPWEGTPEVKDLKRRVDGVLEDATREKAAADKEAKEAARRKELEGELAKAKKAKDAKAVAKLEKALAPAPAAQVQRQALTPTEKAARAKQTAKARLTREEKVAARELAPACAKAAQKVAAGFKIPDAHLEELVERLSLEIYYHTRDGHPEVLKGLADAVARHLPGKWDLVDVKKGERLTEPGPDSARDGKARRAYLGLWAWWQGDGLEAAVKQIRAAGLKRLAARDKAKKAPKAPARKGGRK